MRCLALSLTALVVCAFCLGAAGDIVYLKDGRKFEGTVREVGGKVTIKMRLGTMTFAKSLVDRIERKKTPKQEYAARLAALKPSDVDGRLALAAWCRKNKLAGQAKSLFREIVKLDPTNDVAHKALGHVYQDGEWRTKADAMRRAGFVMYKGKWVLADEKAMIERRKYLEKATVEKAEIIDGKTARIHLTHPSGPRAIPATIEKLDGGNVQLRGVGWPLATAVALADLQPKDVYAIRRRFADPGDAAIRAELARYCERNGLKVEALAEARAAAGLDPLKAEYKMLVKRLAGTVGEAPPAEDRGAELDKIKALWAAGKAQSAMERLSALLRKGVGAREAEARGLLGQWMAASAGRTTLIDRLRKVAAALDSTKDKPRLDFLQTLMEFLTPALTPRTNTLLGQPKEGKYTRDEALALAQRVEIGLIYRDEPSIVSGTEARGGSTSGKILTFHLAPAIVVALEKWLIGYRATFDKTDRRALRRKLPKTYPRLKLAQMAAIVRRGRRYPRKMRPGTSTQKYIVAAEGSTTVYHLFIPPGYSPFVEHPLMVYMHSKRGSGEQGMGYFKKIAAERGWLLCCPTATKNRFKGWGGSEGERSTTLSAIDDLRYKCNVDLRRVYIGGAAMGAHGTWSIAMHYPDRMAAIFPVLGAPRIKRYRLLNNLQHVSVFAAQGALDNGYLVLGVRYTMGRLTAMRFKSKYREYAHLGHTWPPGVEREFADWVADKRQPLHPKKVILRTLADPHTRSYWLEVIDFNRDVGAPLKLPATFARLDEATRRLRSIDLFESRVAHVSATIAGPNIINIRGNGHVYKVRVHLAPGMIDFSKKLKIKYNGKLAFDGRVTPSLDYLLETTRRRDDRIGYAAIDIRAK